MAWTQFMDMHSGGDAKEDPYEYIYIEASADEAVRIFSTRFGHNPNRVTCTCCGEDYSISEAETLEEATGFERGCDWNKTTRRYEDMPGVSRWGYTYVSLDEYRRRKNVLIIPAVEIADNERRGSVPAQGYVWID